MSSPRTFTSDRQPPPIAEGPLHALTRTQRLFDWLLIRQRRLCFVAIMAVTALFALHAPDLRVDPNIDKTFPENDPHLADYQDLRATFGAGEDTALCVLEFPGNVLERDSLARIHELTETLRQEPLIDGERVLSLSDATFVRVDDEGELQIGPLYSPDRYDTWDAAEIDKLLVGHPAFDQRLVSRDRHLAGFWIPEMPNHETDASRAAFVARLRTIFSHSPQGELRAGETAHLEGFAVARQTVLEMILEDSWSLFPLAFLALLLVLAALFRQVVAPLLALTVIACSTLWTVGGMAWAGIPFNTLSACIPVMVLVASIGDVVHLLSRYRGLLADGMEEQTALQDSVLHVLGPCLLTSLTTAAGFASLGFSHIQSLREFGLPVAAGVMAAFVITMGAVPCLISWLPIRRPQAEVREQRTALGAWVQRLVTTRPMTVLGTAAVLVVASLVALPGLSRDASLFDDLDPDTPLLKTRKLLEDRFGGAASLQVVLDTSSQPGRAMSPEVQKALLRLTDDLRTDEFRQLGVLSAISLPDFLRDAYHTWNGRQPEFNCLPDDGDALAQLQFLYQFCPRDPTADLVDSVDDPGKMRIPLRINNLRASEFFTMVDAVEARAHALLPPDVKITITGSTFMARLVTQSLVSQMLQSAGIAIFLVGGMVGVFFRSVRLALLGVLCSGLPLLLVLGVMAVSGTALTLSTSIVFALAFGISVDDTVHMLSCYNHRREQGDADPLGNALRDTGEALVLSTVALVLGFSVMLASNFPANRTFAWLLSLTLIFALAADLLFLPTLLHVGQLGLAGLGLKLGELVPVWQPQARPAFLPVAAAAESLTQRVALALRQAPRRISARLARIQVTASSRSPPWSGAPPPRPPP